MFFNTKIKLIVFKLVLAILAVSYLAVLGFLMKEFSARAFVMTMSLSIALGLVYGNYNVCKRNSINESSLDGNSSNK